jgi:hypothetical protein
MIALPPLKSPNISQFKSCISSDDEISINSSTGSDKTDNTSQLTWDTFIIGLLVE